jgi:hypothetical protein
MNLSVAIFVFCTYCAIQVASDANYVITFDAQAPITQVRFSLKSHKILLLTPLQFIYQLSIPVSSPDSNNAGDAQGVWAGVTTADGQTLVQNVVENQDGGPSSWFIKPIYCCRHAASSSTSKQKADPVQYILGLE